MSFLVYDSDETYWCNDSEVIIEVEQGVLLCPTLEQATMRFSDAQLHPDQCDTHSSTAKEPTTVPTTAGDHIPNVRYSFNTSSIHAMLIYA